jgi:hypothetical protein
MLLPALLVKVLCIFCTHLSRCMHVVTQELLNEYINLIFDNCTKYCQAVPVFVKSGQT